LITRHREDGFRHCVSAALIAAAQRLFAGTAKRIHRKDL
jgi:hypothetical protein